jgi:hypothetical protein
MTGCFRIAYVQQTLIEKDVKRFGLIFCVTPLNTLHSFFHKKGNYVPY